MSTLRMRTLALMGAVLLPSISWATVSEDAVEYKCLYYQLDEATKTATFVAINNEDEDIYDLSIPSTINIESQTYTVTAIAEGVAEQLWFESLTVPATVSEIAERAFVSCEFGRITFLMESDFLIYETSFEDCCCYNSCSVPLGTGKLYSMLPFDNIREPNFRTGGLAYKLDAETLTAKLVPDTDEEYEMPENVYSGSIEIPDHVTYKGKDYSVTAIGNYVFYRCSSLTSVTLPACLKEIGESAFEECEHLTGIVLPEGLRSIGYSAFFGCKRLGTITIPSTVEEIDGDAFYACYFRAEDFVNLSELEGYFGATICDIDEQGLVMNRDDEGTLRVFEYTGSGSTVIIPEGVEYICDGAFQHSRDLHAVQLPSTLSWLGDWAFAYSGLRSITLPEACTHMGEMCFNDCDELQEVDIKAPNIVLSIKSFASCDNLKEFTIRKGMSLTPSTFEYSGLVHVTIEEGSVSVIPEYCFQCCGQLQEITIPGTVTQIERMAFYSCDNLSRIVLQEGVASIGSSAFYGHRTLQELIIPSSLSNIAISEYQGVFEDCSIMRSNFHNNSKLKPEDGYNWGLTFFDREVDGLQIDGATVLSCSKNATDVVVPEGITKIAPSAFYDCSSLQSLVLPQSLTEIGFSAFSGCSGLSSLTIPAGVTEMGAGALYRCFMLSDKFINLSDATDEDDEMWGLTLIDEETDKGLLLTEDGTLLSIRPTVTTLVVPTEVTAIDADAFWQRESLRYLIFTQDVSELDPEFLYNLPDSTSVFLPRDSYTSILESWSDVIDDTESFEYCTQHVFVNEDVNEDHSLDVSDAITLLNRMKDGLLDRDINLDGVIDEKDTQAVLESILEW